MKPDDGPGGLRRAPGSLGVRAVSAGLLLGFVVATNRWMSWDAGFRLLLVVRPSFSW
jgi:hypothetical protein